MIKSRNVPGEQLSFFFYEPSYESKLFHWLYRVDRFFEKSKMPYALFGGAAVAAYIGHLPRKLHDLDVIVREDDLKLADDFMRAEGFELQQTLKSQKANYRKYLLENHLYEIIISFFPGRFTLLNVNQEDLPILGCFDFSHALERAERRRIKSLGGQGGISVKVVPIEDLIISKLWPTFEPNTVHDLVVLLATVRGNLDLQYMKSRVCEAGSLGDLARQSLGHFAQVYKSSVWSSLGKGSDRVNQLLEVDGAGRVLLGVHQQVPRGGDGEIAVSPAFDFVEFGGVLDGPASRGIFEHGRSYKGCGRPVEASPRDPRLRFGRAIAPGRGGRVPG